MLESFRDEGRVDLLRALRDKVLTFADAYDAYRRSALGELATADTAKPLQKAWTRWIENADATRKHKESWEQSGRYLAKADGRARVADIPRLVRKLRDTLGKEHPRSFNLLRAAASAFIRDTLTRAQPAWQAFQASAAPVRMGGAADRCACGTTEGKFIPAYRGGRYYCTGCGKQKRAGFVSRSAGTPNRSERPLSPLGSTQHQESA